MSQLDDLRFRMLRHNSNLSSFRNSWPVWKPEILRIVGTNPTGDDLFNLGEHLSQIFRSRSITGRTNTAVSTGGAAWESLVCWYLNLVLHGTNAIVVKPVRGFMPPAISDAIAVNLGNHSTNTESDLVGFSLNSTNLQSSVTFDQIDRIIRHTPQSVDVAVIQCKTNWNDNAQIPMLWDLIYSTERFRVPNVSVGRSGIGPASFKNFSYSFMTVPTSRGPFKPNSLSVLRVLNLSGGNYWGLRSKPGVALSISEFFQRNFSSVFTGSVQNSIEKNVITDPEVWSAYLDLSF